MRTFLGAKDAPPDTFQEVHYLDYQRAWQAALHRPGHRIVSTTTWTSWDDGEKRAGYLTHTGLPPAETLAQAAAQEAAEAAQDAAIRRGLGNALAQHRDGTVVTKWNLAAKLGVNVRVIEKFEESGAGDGITLDFILQYARAINATIEINVL
ncbi:hypothetical protein [Streptomyces sp. CBMA29]|uniref:hypothetical protein n=1 Tax=Streptomyces sp. CBMA29 TaxID=1896314 RepID=UPI001661A7F1|nr:hypothetical protein [Streptomyces sp. CBMA29]